ncbi:MAG: DUF308 domain-containing protein [Peptostreptococcaceae bacterium]|nr:DUF308 domain-containing protein [Peptostreptococcaceae bacterium]
MEIFKSLRLSAIMSSVIMLILGFALTTNPEMSIKMICYGCSAAFIAFGITNLFGYFIKKSANPKGAIFNLVVCIFTVLLGLFIFIRPVAVSSIIPIILGLTLVVDGALLFIMGFTFRKELPKKGLIAILIGLGIVVFGAIIVLYPFESEVILITFIGISLIVAGLSNLIHQFIVEHKLKKLEKESI